jgi:MOSC domain-containing protein YiiM
VRIGDRYRVGEALLEVMAPRIPCATFATRMGEPNWVQRFAAARRPGLYVRVLEPGEVAVGDRVDRLGGDDGCPPVVDLMDVWYEPGLLERLLDSPIAERARGNVERKLAQALAGR